jgi:hypothetical protein
MKKVIMFTFIINSILCFAQQERRSKKFKINAGFEYRIVPYFFKNPEGAFIGSSLYISNMSKHLSGNSINFDIEYFFLKNTTIGISQSFRYDELYTELFPPSIDGPQNYTTDTHMRFISDTEIQLKHYFPLKADDQSIIAVAGYGFMNNNTLFHASEVVLDENGELLYTRTREIDFQFQSYKIGIGYKYKSLEIIAGTYIAEHKHGFELPRETGFGIPFLRLSYNISKF